jgi:hypothetical protein
MYEPICCSRISVDCDLQNNNSACFFGNWNCRFVKCSLRFRVKYHSEYIAPRAEYNVVSACDLKRFESYVKLRYAVKTTNGAESYNFRAP